MVLRRRWFHLLFFFNDTATTEIYTLSLHDALPILVVRSVGLAFNRRMASHTASGSRLGTTTPPLESSSSLDRKSTRLNSSHSQISYAVFCLKKKKKANKEMSIPGSALRSLFSQYTS